MCFFDILPITGYITSIWYDYEEDVYYVKIPKATPDSSRPFNLIQHMKTLGHNVTWIPGSDFRQIEPIESCAKYEIYSATWYNRRYAYARYIFRTTDDAKRVVLIPLGATEKITQEFNESFIRTYSFDITWRKALQSLRHLNKYYQFIDKRHRMICGFTEMRGRTYLVANWIFHYYYLLYGFCSECGLLRCTPVWCICGHKQLSNDWTSSNAQLDRFIRKTQERSEFIFEPFLEWIPYDSVAKGLSQCNDVSLLWFISSYQSVTQMCYRRSLVSTPLDITVTTPQSYYEQVELI